MKTIDSEAQTSGAFATVDAIEKWPLTGDAAKALGVSDSKIVRMANDGTLKTTRDAAGHRRYDPVSLSAASVLLANRRGTQRAPQITNALADGDLTATVFEKLRAGVEPVNLVIEMRLPAALVKRLVEEYDALQGDKRAFVRRFDKRALERIQRVLPDWKEEEPTDRGLIAAIQSSGKQSFEAGRRQAQRQKDGDRCVLELTTADNNGVLALVPQEVDEDGDVLGYREVDLTSALDLSPEERALLRLYVEPETEESFALPDGREIRIVVHRNERGSVLAVLDKDGALGVPGAKLAFKSAGGRLVSVAAPKPEPSAAGE